MGNTDGFVSATASRGQNKVVDFDGGWFSFAFGDEIAFCVDGKYYILNCTNSLFKEVKQKVEGTKDRKKLERWWKEKSKHYKINVWSNDFSELCL